MVGATSTNLFGMKSILNEFSAFDKGKKFLKAKKNINIRLQYEESLISLVPNNKVSSS